MRIPRTIEPSLWQAEAFVGLVDPAAEVEERAAGHVEMLFRSVSHEYFVHVRLNEVVRLKDADIFARCPVKTDVHRVAVAGVLLRNHANARILRRKIGKNLRRGIGRAVVDAENLEIPVGLPDEACERFIQERRHIEARHDDGELHRAAVGGFREPFCCGQIERGFDHLVHVVIAVCAEAAAEENVA